MVLPEVPFSASLVMGSRLVSPTELQSLRNLALGVALENQQIQTSLGGGRGFQHPGVSQCPYRDLLSSKEALAQKLLLRAAGMVWKGGVRHSLKPIVGHSVFYRKQPTPKTARNL